MQVNTPTDGQVTLDNDKPFVEGLNQTAQPGEGQVAGWQIVGPDNYVVGVEQNTPVAIELRDANGDKVAGDTRVTIQKCDKQGNPIGSAIAFTELMSRFEYSKMRTDKDYFRYTQSDLMIDEDEIVKIFVDVPGTAEDAVDFAQSRFVVGDDTSNLGKPVEIVSHDSLSAQESQAVKQAAKGGN